MSQACITTDTDEYPANCPLSFRMRFGGRYPVLPARRIATLFATDASLGILRSSGGPHNRSQELWVGSSALAAPRLRYADAALSMIASFCSMAFVNIQPRAISESPLCA